MITVARARTPPRLLQFALRARCLSTRPTATNAAPILSDERIKVEGDYNRWLQLAPACATGLAVGTYAAVPGVLTPYIARAHGVVAATACDFTASSVPQILTFAGITTGLLSIVLAPYASVIGTRRLAFVGSIGFPAGFYGISALAVHANSLPLYMFSQIAIGGVGFYCLYPQVSQPQTARQAARPLFARPPAALLAPHHWPWASG